LVAKRATKVVCKSLAMGKRSRFLAKKDIGATPLHTSDVYHIHCCKEIWLVRGYHSFSAVGPMRSHGSLHPVEIARVPTLMTVLPPYTATMLGNSGL
jgi:hypothetical protein